MSTNCITKVYNGNDCILCLYRHWDGDSHGQELVDFLKDKRLMYGYHNETLNEAFNGMGCLAAALVAHFKTEIGNFYLMPVNTMMDYEYNYRIDDSNGKIRVEMFHNEKFTTLLGS